MDFFLVISEFIMHGGLFLVCHWVLLWNEVSGCLWGITLLDHSSLTTATLLLDIYVVVHVWFFPWYAKLWWTSLLLFMFWIIYYVKFLKASCWVEGTVCSKTLDSHSPVQSPERLSWFASQLCLSLLFQWFHHCWKSPLKIVSFLKSFLV